MSVKVISSRLFAAPACAGGCAARLDFNSANLWSAAVCVGAGSGLAMSQGKVSWLRKTLRAKSESEDSRKPASQIPIPHEDKYTRLFVKGA